MQMSCCWSPSVDTEAPLCYGKFLGGTLGGFPSLCVSERLLQVSLEIDCSSHLHMCSPGGTDCTPYSKSESSTHFWGIRAVQGLCDSDVQPKASSLHEPKFIFLLGPFCHFQVNVTITYIGATPRQLHFMMGYYLLARKHVFAWL